MTASALLGTWRVTSFTRWNREGVAGQPLGAEPVGYAVFDPNGRAFIQLGKNPASGVPADEVAKSLMCYFGPFTITGDAVAVSVESSSIPEYVGSTQVRQFEIDGDALTMGTPGRYRATLTRVR